MSIWRWTSRRTLFNAWITWSLRMKARRDRMKPNKKATTVFDGENVENGLFNRNVPAWGSL